MRYSTRMQLALAASAALHVAVLAVARMPDREPALGLADTREPIVLNLQQDEREAPKRLVESGAEREERSEDTDLISDKNTQAQDQSDTAGEDNRPAVDELSEFDELARAVSPTPPVPPQMPGVSESQPAAEPAESEPREESEAEPQEAESESDAEASPAQAESPPERDTPEDSTGESQPAAPDTREPDAAAEQAEAVAEARPTEQPAEDKTQPQPEETVPEAIEPEPLMDQVMERYSVAQAPEVAPQSAPDTGKTRGREGGGAETKGAVSFEANEHAFGAYMQEIRRRVERKWRTAIQLRYSGTQPTSAVVECAISPNGDVLYVNVAKEGNSATYGALCRKAILDAGPFPPFPFSVPSVYRTRNLEIRWKFSYM